MCDAVGPKWCSWFKHFTLKQRKRRGFLFSVNVFFWPKKSCNVVGKAHRITKLLYTSGGGAIRTIASDVSTHPENNKMEFLVFWNLDMFEIQPQYHKTKVEKKGGEFPMSNQMRPSHSSTDCKNGVWKMHSPTLHAMDKRFSHHHKTEREISIRKLFT